MLSQALAARIPGRRTAAWHGWDYDTPAERDRHVRTIEAAHSASGGATWGSVLEVGCAAGHFTTQLAPLAVSVTACDLTPAACRLAEERCRGLAHVAVSTLDLARDPIPGVYDAVFAMDVLEYLHGARALDAAASKLTAALRHDGVLAVTCTRLPRRLERSWWARWLTEGGAEIVDFLTARPTLRLVHREDHEAPADTGYCPHVIAVFQRA